MIFGQCEFIMLVAVQKTVQGVECYTAGTHNSLI
jgi:hypothetical protein